ncbi:MAG: tetratricopeptide repeat protein [Anaerolineales bacterium]|nr:tetratricopeptide repeat protein [Anaerolineales bacterium]
MSDPFTFSETLRQLVDASGYTPGQLAQLADLPKTTIVNWLNGRVIRPRHGDPLLQLGRALRLTSAEMDDLLTAAQHPSLHEFISQLDQSIRHTLPEQWLAPSTNHLPTPFQAPPDIPYFVGRETLLTELQQALQQETHQTIYVLHGMGGIGKTAVATRLAYLCRPFFEDGVLWARVDISEPLNTLQSVARAFGYDVSGHTTLTERSQTVRGLLAHRQALLVLDNAEASEQIRPLLPPTGRCAVLVTSRRQDLAVFVGATRWELTPFAHDSDTAVQLFTRLLGPRVAAHPPDTLHAIAQTLGHHPLALTIAASRLAYETGWQASSLLERLTAASQRLPTLHFETASINASFQVSYEGLNTAERSFLATLSLFGGDSFSAQAAAAAAACTLWESEDRLRRLASLSLIQPHSAQRYTLHPLMRDFAQMQSQDASTFERLVRYYESYLQTHPPHTAALQLEYDNIVHLLEQATAAEQEATLPLIIALAPYWITQGLYQAAVTYLARGLTSTKHTDKRPWLLRYRGEVARLQQEMTLAESLLQEALALTAAETSLHTAVLAELGVVASCEGRTAAAATYFEQALQAAEQERNLDVLAVVLEELGMLAISAGDYEKAAVYFARGLDALREHMPGGVTLRKSWGAIHFLQGDYEQAAALFNTAFALAQTAGYQSGQATLLNNLAAVDMVAQDWSAAVEKLHQADTLAQQLAHGKMQAIICANLGQVQLALQHPEQAHYTLQQAAALGQQYNVTTIMTKVDAALAAYAQKQSLPPNPTIFI